MNRGNDEVLKVRTARRELVPIGRHLDSNVPRRARARRRAREHARRRAPRRHRRVADAAPCRRRRRAEAGSTAAAASAKARARDGEERAAAESARKGLDVPGQ
jgi:hypothetical protein